MYTMSGLNVVAEAKKEKSKKQTAAVCRCQSSKNPKTGHVNLKNRCCTSKYPKKNGKIASIQHRAGTYIDVRFKVNSIIINSKTTTTTTRKTLIIFHLQFLTTLTKDSYLYSAAIG